ncbi:hypothetical protein PSHT_09588, partial [Puccinia striiformis]
MSRRSRLSTLSALSGLSTTAKSNGDELYQYSLRVAYLAYLSSVRLLALKNEESSGTANLTHIRILIVLIFVNRLRPGQNTIFSIADVFKDGSGSTKSDKSVKFPKDLVKVLKVRIEAIAKGTDKNYQDLSLRSSFGVFYGTYTQDYYLKQLKENRNVEALILLLVTTATGVLRKRLEGDKWKIYLNSQVGVFVTIIRDYSQLQKDLNNVRKNCSEKAAFEDFKLCVANIAQQCRFPGRRADFDPDEVYREWRTKELAQIQHAMLQMIRANPDLARSKTYSAATTTATIHNSNPNPLDDFVLVGNTQIIPLIIPPVLIQAPVWVTLPHRVLKVLIRFRVLNILTGSSELHYQHRDSMDQVLDWNDVSEMQREAQIHMTVKSYRPLIPLMDQCFRLRFRVHEKLSKDEESYGRIKFDGWATRDSSHIRLIMKRAMSSLFDTLLRRVYEAIESVLESNPTVPTNDDNPQQLPNEIIPFLELTASINTVQDIESMKHILLPPPSPNSTHPLQPILPDLHLLVGYTPVDPTRFNDADVLELYRALIEIEKKHNMSAEKKTSEWVQSAIKADTFSPQGNDSHSNSIIDLEDSCCSAVAFIQKLKWSNEFQNAEFMTKLARIISKSIEQYSAIIEQSFVEEVFPKASTDAHRSAIWARARLSCVKLNNVETARVLLDKGYNTIDAGHVARIMHEYEPTGPSGKNVDTSISHLFTVKVVMAEGLAGSHGNAQKMDPFLTLSDEKGNRVGQDQNLHGTTFLLDGSRKYVPVPLEYENMLQKS